MFFLSWQVKAIITLFLEIIREKKVNVKDKNRHLKDIFYLFVYLKKSPKTLKLKEIKEYQLKSVKWF